MESNTIETNASENQSQDSGQQVARYAELQRLVTGMAADFEKFYRDGNKAAGTRVRNAMQELKVFAQNVRTEVQAIKNGKDPAAASSEAEASDDTDVQ